MNKQQGIGLGGGKVGRVINDYNEAAKLYRDCAESVGKADDQYSTYIGKSKKCAYRIARLEKVRQGKWHGLEGIGAAASVFLLLSGLFFTFNFTGNVVGGLVSSARSIFGIVLIIVGIVLGFFCVKEMNK